MTAPADGRGGSVPPRPPAAAKPQQWFTLRPWVFDVTMAGVLLRAAPRPPVPIPVEAWARAYGLDREPGSGRHAISLIGPGPDFSPQYAMTTNPDEPVILATLAGPGGEPMPLLIDGCHRLHKAAVTGRADIPAWVLTTAETLLIRSDAVLGRPGGRGGGPTMSTVCVWHNVAHDAEAGTPRCWTATSPAIPWSASSPTRPTPPGPRRRSPRRRSPSATATPATPFGEDLSRRYYQRGLRSLSFPGKEPCCPR